MDMKNYLESVVQTMKNLGREDEIDDAIDELHQLTDLK